MLSRDNIGCIPFALIGGADAALRMQRRASVDADARR
jgi:hypothetical protein